MTTDMFPFDKWRVLLAFFLLYKLQGIFVTYWLRRPVR